MKQTLKIGITVLVVAALAISGMALAQTGDADDTVPITETPAYARIIEKLEPLVDDGTLTDDQAEAVAEALASGFNPRHPRRPHLGAIAEFLGMEGEEFREALQDYDTLAELAAANGSSGAELIEFLVGRVAERLDQAVADGKIEESEADDKLVAAEEKITEMVNSEIPGRAGKRPFRSGGGFGAGFGDSAEGPGSGAITAA